MSLRSRTLRAKLLRLSRRAMRLTIRLTGEEARRPGLPHRRFAQLTWRRARALWLPRERAAPLHLHQSHFLVRPDVRVSVQMVLAAARAARWAAAVSLQLTWRRSPETPQRQGGLGRRSGARLLAEPRSSRLRRDRPLVESPAAAAPGVRRLAARALMSWPVRAGERVRAAEPAGYMLRHTDAMLVPAARHRRAYSGRTEHPSVRERPRRRESPFLPRLVPSRLLDYESRGVHARSFRSSTLPSAVRLRRRERVGAATVSNNPLAWREVAPLPLHYASPKAAGAPLPLIEPAAVTTAPPAVRPMQAAAQSARAMAAPTLDRAATDRLADEVIRRIERRVRIERERRGI